MPYKNSPITIRMKDFSHMEQYEIIRLILGYERTNVKICTHESTSKYIDEILKKLPVEFIQCFVELPVLQTFDFPASPAPQTE